MEQALLELEDTQSEAAPKLSQNEWNEIESATSDLVKAIQAALKNLIADADSEEAKADVSDNDAAVSIDWLLSLVSTVPSSLSASHLAREIYGASKLKDEAQQQAVLFDTLGEGGMEVMFEIVGRMKDIARIPASQFDQLDGGVGSASASMMMPPQIDPEEQRKRILLEEVKSTAHIAAMAQAEADLAESSAGGGTHTVTRKSDMKLQKEAKKAAKRAEQAMKAAKEAGAIVDDADWRTMTNSAAATYGVGGLMNQSTEELQMLQQSLLPEGSRQYYDKQGLPKGTEREYGAFFEKVTIPAARRDETKLPRRLNIDEIMDRQCAKAFDGTKSLNPMQSSVFETAFKGRENIMLCAPTGAGKTNVAMLSVIAHFRDVGLVPGHDAVLETGGKVVYIAPMKALAQEVVEKFSGKLTKSLGLIVRELTGDMQLTRAEAASANILVTTPEKWDVVTRKSGQDENSLGNQCGLLIIDEVHLLADERGAVIESVVARLHRLVESRQRQTRIVALSATLPNYEDVASFLQVPPKGLFYFGPEHRPVPLQQSFIGISAKTKDRFIKEQRMNEVCYEIVVDSLRRGYQVMVFVHSRKGTGDTAGALAELAQNADTLERHFVTQGKEGTAGDAHKRYKDRVGKSRNREVQNHFVNGLGIHHAGMLRGDRKLTEMMFSDGAIKVLCCTATLAWGVNLPAHTVIVKGTEVYNPEKGGMMDLSILDVQQIFGRAGRPQFDSSGEATLITTHDGLPRYLDKMVRAVPIESNFIKQLADHLNAEVVGGTVTTIKEAATWLTYTYLHVRMMRNPLAYGISMDQKNDDPMLRGRSLELVTEAAKLLDENQMVRFDPSGNLGVTDAGRTAAHFYIQAESVAIFNDKFSTNISPTDAQLCNLVCLATEFQNVRIRQEELGELEGLCKKCPLKVEPPIHEPSDKAFVLMQAFISRLNIRSFTLISDTNYIASNGGRVARAMFEMCLKQGNAGPAIKLLRIAKSIDRRIWWFQSPLRQFEGELKEQVLKAIESKQLNGSSGYDTFDYTLSLLDMQPQEVGHLFHWAKGGDKIQKLIKMLPYVEINCKVQPITSSVLRFHITLDPYWRWQNRWHGGAQSFWVWVEDGDNNRIYHNEQVLFSRRTHPESITLDVTIPAFDPLPKQYFLRVVSDSWVGVETVVPVSFKDITMPKQRTPYTDLIDLTPLPTTALQNKDYDQLYQKYETFNPIQTQLFHVLYHTDTPVLCGAPTGSGKTTIAELALLRMKNIHPKGICVYIAPLKSLARERLKEWRQRFGGHPLKWNVLELSGDTHHDQKALSSADVLVCTPEKWDLISRGWKGNKTLASDSNVSNGKEFVRRVRLLVIDEIHLLGEDRGAVLEAIVSRTRFVSQFMETEQNKKTGGNESKEKHEYTRIMGLSTAVANPYDLADWLGIDTKGYTASALRGLYNFRPSVRPIPMEVHMQGFPGKHYCPRMATMNKPCYAAIQQHSPTKPVLIFVASRRQTRLTALDIISYAAADEKPRAFLGCSDDFIESVAETLEDEALRHTICFGIGIHHAGLSTNDRDTVERLFLGGEIRVLVATATLAWGVNLPAHFVIVKGTEYYDGKTSRYVDYPLTDVLQMLGRAGRPGFDTSGVGLVMVARDKKNFYKKFLYSPFPVESCLDEKMCENLNAEIAIGTISSIIDAVGYLTWTFFARRVKGNPSYYGATSDSEEDVEDFLLKTVLETVDLLKEHGCVEVEEGEENDRAVSPTVLGQTATNYYLQYRTPKQMQFGVTQARKLIATAIEEDDGEKAPRNPNGKPNQLQNFSRSERVDEISLAWLLYAMSSTPEFDELPVRHNEEHLNADLAEELMWGADTTIVLNPDATPYINMDVMADPHTKCFLLIQAHLEYARLPISDYINDTKTVLDQVPRLLAAMHYIAIQDKTIAGNFDLVTQFSRARQYLATRTLVGDDPLSYFPGFSKDNLGRMRNHCRSSGKEMPSVWSLRSVSMDDATSRLKGILKSKKNNVDKMIKSIFAIPRYTIEDLKVSTELDKVTRNNVGKLIVELKIEYDTKSRGRNGRDSPITMACVLGTFQQGILLSYSSIGIAPSGSKAVTKKVEFSFDWSVANASGGADGGKIVLRFLMEDVRGMDSEILVPLR